MKTLAAVAVVAVLQAGPVLAAWSGVGTRPETGPGETQKVAVFGEDNRTFLPAPYRALESKIGLLYDRRTRTVCTAFCASETVIATAAHCLFRTAGERPPRLSDLTFRILAKGKGSVTPLAGVSSGSGGQFVVTGSTELSVKPPIDATSDWALAKLAAPACTAGGLPFSRRTPAMLAKEPDAPAVYQVAFHRDFVNWRLAYDKPCGVGRDFLKADWLSISRDFHDPERLLLHTCDTGGASSGSPLLIDGPRGPEVVGINVGTYVQSRVLLEKGEVVHRYKADTIANTAVGTEAFLPALDNLMRADILAARAPLIDLQRLLAQRGLYTGPFDGIYGRSLRSAIRAFEMQEGRIPTGIASSDLYRRVALSVANARPPAVAKSPPAIETGSVGHATETAARPSAKRAAPSP